MFGLALLGLLIIGAGAAAASKKSSTKKSAPKPASKPAPKPAPAPAPAPTGGASTWRAIPSGAQPEPSTPEGQAFYGGEVAFEANLFPMSVDLGSAVTIALAKVRMTKIATLANGTIDFNGAFEGVVTQVVTDYEGKGRVKVGDKVVIGGF